MMTMSRRKAIAISGSTLAGLSLGGLKSAPLQAVAQDDWPDSLVERPLREGFPAPLPLNPDGSAPEHPESAAGPISEPFMWRTQGRQTPETIDSFRSRWIRGGSPGFPAHSGSQTLSRCRRSRTRFCCSVAHQIPEVSSSGLVSALPISQTCLVSFQERTTAASSPRTASMPTNHCPL